MLRRITATEFLLPKDRNFLQKIYKDRKGTKVRVSCSNENLANLAYLSALSGINVSCATSFSNLQRIPYLCPMKNTKLAFLIWLHLLFSGSLLAQLPAYYDWIQVSDSGLLLKQQLANLITSTHTTQLSYTPDIWNVLQESDLDPTNTSVVLLLYGYNDSDGATINDRTRAYGLYQTGSSNVGVWNREHTFPKSLGTPDLGTSGPGADAHHLRAADGEMNALRDNRIFTYGSGNAMTVGSDKFYPGDEWKGDVARMIMYMYLRYPSQCIASNVGEPAISISNFDQMPDIFILWNEQDPVSNFETQRNEVIYQAQGNRNPFIDEPAFANQIWRATSYWGIGESTKTKIQLYPNPVSSELTVDLQHVTTWTYRLVNLVGEEVQRGTKTEKISLATLPQGIYVLSISTPEGLLHHRIEKK